MLGRSVICFKVTGWGHPVSSNVSNNQTGTRVIIIMGHLRKSDAWTSSTARPRV